VAATLDAVQRAVVPGISTAELDEVAARALARAGARSGPILTYGYPGSICISVGSDVVHGVPDERVLRDGELVSIDVAAEVNGYYADAARTVPVGEVAEPGLSLLSATREALQRGISAAQPGATLQQIGGAVEAVARSRGFSVVRELTGHGIGRKMHEPPTVYNWPSPDARRRLTSGLVLTIEPMLVAGSPHITVQRDGWTVSTVDGSAAAHEEHTIVVTNRGPLVLTHGETR